MSPEEVKGHMSRGMCFSFQQYQRMCWWVLFCSTFQFGNSIWCQVYRGHRMSASCRSKVSLGGWIEKASLLMMFPQVTSSLKRSCFVTAHEVWVGMLHRCFGLLHLTLLCSEQSMFDKSLSYRKINHLPQVLCDWLHHSHLYIEHLNYKVTKQRTHFLSQCIVCFLWGPLMSDMVKVWYCNPRFEISPAVSNNRLITGCTDQISDIVGGGFHDRHHYCLVDLYIWVQRSRYVKEVLLNNVVGKYQSVTGNRILSVGH